MALGFGFRCGFLGLLHMEIVQERLRREFDLDIISTYPGVRLPGRLETGRHDRSRQPRASARSHHDRLTSKNPILTAYIICQNEHIGDIMQLIMDRRGEVEKTESIDTRRVMLTCTLPLNEILIDFYDKLKSVSRGYASMDYEHAGYQTVGPRASWTSW